MPGSTPLPVDRRVVGHPARRARPGARPPSRSPPREPTADTATAPDDASRTGPGGGPRRSGCPGWPSRSAPRWRPRTGSTRSPLAARVPAGIAWLYPLITDGLALVAYAATARLTGAGRRYAWAVVVLAAGLSGLAQASYLAGGATLDAPPALRFGVGAWPAVAAAVVAHLLYLLAADHGRTHPTRSTIASRPRQRRHDRRPSTARPSNPRARPRRQPDASNAVRRSVQPRSASTRSPRPSAVRAPDRGAARTPRAQSPMRQLGTGRGRPQRARRTPRRPAHRLRARWRWPRSPAAPPPPPSRRSATNRRRCTWSPTPRADDPAMTRPARHHDHQHTTRTNDSRARPANPTNTSPEPENQNHKIKGLTPMHHDPWAGPASGRPSTARRGSV